MIIEYYTMSQFFEFQRIVIVGVAGSGKTTLARQFSLYLNLPHIELDALYWEANWTPVNYSVFQERVSNKIKDGAWIVDGNYNEIRDLVWSKAELFIWLDYSLSLVILRLIKRTFQRITKRENLWNGNHEHFSHLFSSDSIFLVVLRNFRKRQREYSRLFSETDYAHTPVIRIRSRPSTSALPSIPYHYIRRGREGAQRNDGERQHIADGPAGMA